MNKENEGVCYLRQMFPDAEIKEDIFVGPHIRYVISDKQFKVLLIGPEKISGKHSRMWLRIFLATTEHQAIFH